MANRHVEGLYITRPVSIAYLTGFFAEPHERLMGLVVRRDGATLIVPALEQRKAMLQSPASEVVAWRDGEDPYELVAHALPEMAEAGVEKEHLTLHAAEVIMSRT